MTGKEILKELLKANPLLPKATSAEWSSTGYITKETPGQPTEYTTITIKAKYNNGYQTWTKRYKTTEAAALLPHLKKWFDTRFPNGLEPDEDQD